MTRPVVQLAILLLAVPAQYLISRWMTPSSSDRDFLTQKFVVGAINTCRKLLKVENWKKWIVEILDYNYSGSNGQKLDNGECIAVEVFKYKEPHGYFSSSPEPRSPRPSKVRFRVGQVIKHKIYGYRGIIVGWDTKTKAPDFWIQANHNNPSWRHTPNYSILVDVRDRGDAQTTYVVEENIEIIINVEVRHPEKDDYFEAFDGAQYLMRPWLRTLYPHD